MTNDGQTFCIICGKKRIFFKNWKEKVDGRGTIVTITKSVCPDKKCQKKVDAKFDEIRKRREATEDKRREKQPIKKTPPQQAVLHRV